MNLLNRVMSYDKTKNENQEQCNCAECLGNAEISEKKKIAWNFKYADDFLIKVENYRMMCREKEILNTMNTEYWYKDVKTKWFIFRALWVHGNKYDYHKTKYTKYKEKVEITCRVKGHKSFPQTPSDHLDGHGCKLCGIKLAHDKTKMTLEEFIEKANEVHGIGRYDYSEVIYKDNKIDVWIICHEHDEPYRFPQTPNEHLQGNGCPLCGIKSTHDKTKMTLEEFIEQANQIHGVGRYDYSKVNYINYNTNVIIICHEHDKPYEFPQTPNTHLNGHGCKLCGIKSAHEKTKMTLEEFIEKSNKIHGIGRYDYSEVDYIDSETYVWIICHEHDEPYKFPQKPRDHSQGHGCPKCGGRLKLTLEEFIEKSNKIHGIGRYDYSKVNYINNKTLVTIICHNHKKPYEFPQTPNDHLDGHGCNLCNKSQGENKIELFLMNNNIEFKKEKKFKDCKDKSQLPFDFYLPQYNLCIEFDGEQHFKPFAFNSRKVSDDIKLENLKKVQKHDQMKNDYCKKKGIVLLRFNNLKTVEQELAEYFQNRGIIEQTIFDL